MKSHRTKKNTLEDFWSRVRRDESGCWMWISTKTSNGHGTISWNSRTTLAHRLSYELVNGPIPPGLYACHRCDVPACVNPDHIFLGTALDNARDMVSKGRAATGSRNGRYTQPHKTSRGEGRPGAKLSWDKVREIRALKGTHTYREIAQMYGVASPQISLVMNNKAWVEVN